MAVRGLSLVEGHRSARVLAFADLGMEAIHLFVV
jgi:hypothetical protein